MLCWQFFTCKETENHTLMLSYLDLFRSWQKNKNYNTELDIKTANPFHNSHAGARDKINSCHVKWYKPDTKSCHASSLHMRAQSAVRLHKMANKRMVGHGGTFTPMYSASRHIMLWQRISRQLALWDLKNAPRVIPDQASSPICQLWV